jgi:hypothetical protein
MDVACHTSLLLLSFDQSLLFFIFLQPTPTLSPERKRETPECHSMPPKKASVVKRKYGSHQGASAAAADELPNRLTAALPVLTTWIIEREDDYEREDTLVDMMADATTRFPLLRVLSLDCVEENQVELLAQQINAFEHLDHLYITFMPMQEPNSNFFAPTSPSYSLGSDDDKEQGNEQEDDDDDDDEEKTTEAIVDNHLANYRLQLEVCARLFQRKLHDGIALHYQKYFIHAQRALPIRSNAFLTPDQLEANYLLQHGYSTLSPCANTHIPHEPIEHRIRITPGQALKTSSKRQRT